MKKTFYIILALIILGVAIWHYTTCDYCLTFLKSNNENDQVIGGDKDEHGCLVAAGYSWCEKKQKCLRTWEESCAIDFSETGNIINRNSKDWILIYEEPGKPALQANLSFTENSICDFGSGEILCSDKLNSNIEEGERVNIEGTNLSDKIVVYKLLTVK